MWPIARLAFGQDRVIMLAMISAIRVGLLLVAWSAVASAGGKTRKVEVESTPEGATVYLNSVDDEPACTPTPCTIDAPIGSSVVIVRKQGYEPEFGQLVVPKKGKIKPFKFSLTGSFGTIAIDDPRLEGATITIDGIDHGIAPQRIDVEPTSHRVAVVLDKKTLFEGDVAVENGASVAIQPTKTSPDSTGETKPAPSASPASTGKAKSVVARARSVAVGALFSVHFRQFRYRGAKTALPTQVESGQDTLGPTLEVWPATLFGSSQLRGLSLYGELEFGLNQLDVVDDASGTSSGAKTHWRRFEVDVRHRWMLGRGGIEANAGYVRDQMRYKGDASQLPIGDYQAVRAGVRTSLRLAKSIDAYAAAEARFALDSGPVAARFGGADVFGGRATVGALAQIGPVFVAVDGSILYYRWTFSDDSVAAGARDVVESISARIGAHY